uniref:Uncharacterized protein n=1 Tax=Solanum lycopersicum TaxID=4081 RepID=A0A3Q7ICT2_SOLLC
MIPQQWAPPCNNQCTHKYSTLMQIPFHPSYIDCETLLFRVHCIRPLSTVSGYSGRGKGFSLRYGKSVCQSNCSLLNLVMCVVVLIQKA